MGKFATIHVIHNIAAGTHIEYYEEFYKEEETSMGLICLKGFCLRP